VGLVAVGAATRWGTGLTPDSASYIGGASSLLAGDGFIMPRADAGPVAITHFPPLYPALIAAASAASGVSPAAAARWLNVLLFGANVFLVGLLARGTAATASWPGALVLGLGGAFFALTSVTLLRMHSMAWSEPAYIFCWLLGVMALVAYRRTSRWPALVAAAACGAAVGLTRYAGLPVVGAAAIMLLFFGRPPLRRRIRDTLLYLMIALGPLALWLVRNFAVAGTATNRGVSWQPLDAGHMTEASRVLASWLLLPTAWLPPAVVGAILLGAIVVGVAVVVADARASRAPADAAGGDAAGVALLLGLFAVIYVAFIAVSITLFDRHVPVDARILSPVFVAGVVVLLHGTRLVGGPRVPLARYAVAAVVCVLAARSLIAGALFVRSSYESGLGFNGAAWRESTVLRAIEQLPPTVAVYSNWPEAVLLRTGRPIARLPWARHLNPSYEADLAGLAARMKAGTSVVAYFRRYRRGSVASEQELLERLPLAQRVRTRDGAIYVLDDAEAPSTPTGRFSARAARVSPDAPRAPHRATARLRPGATW
jgi:hypothetical protein